MPAALCHAHCSLLRSNLTTQHSQAPLSSAAQLCWGMACCGLGCNLWFTAPSGWKVPICVLCWAHVSLSAFREPYGTLVEFTPSGGFCFPVYILCDWKNTLHFLRKKGLLLLLWAVLASWRAVKWVFAFFLPLVDMQSVVPCCVFLNWEHDSHLMGALTYKFWLRFQHLLIMSEFVGTKLLVLIEKRN